MTSSDSDIKPTTDGIHNPPMYRIFVASLDKSVTEDNLKEHFSAWGVLKYIKLVKPQDVGKLAFAFLTFSTSEAVDLVQQNRPHTVLGRKVLTTRCIPGKLMVLYPENSFSTCRLYVPHLPSDATEQQVRSYFEQFNFKVTFVRIVSRFKNDTSAVVHFDDCDAVDKMVAIHIHCICKRIVFVRKARIHYNDEELVPPSSNGSIGGGHDVNCRRELIPINTTSCANKLVRIHAVQGRNVLPQKVFKTRPYFGMKKHFVDRLYPPHEIVTNTVPQGVPKYEPMKPIGNTAA